MLKTHHILLTLATALLLPKLSLHTKLNSAEEREEAQDKKLNTTQERREKMLEHQQKERTKVLAEEKLAEEKKALEERKKEEKNSHSENKRIEVAKTETRPRTK
ncbi:MAG: hypothetical protein QG632_252 [Candidatus Dependentiae bacterium]|nr:hypothetical protein [Candidatus Dependentiae bacterium]